jgi:hypothetical protein
MLVLVQTPDRRHAFVRLFAYEDVQNDGWSVVVDMISWQLGRCEAQKTRESP